MAPITLSSFVIIGFAAAIHASLQLSLSMLTLLSGHALGKKTRHMKLLRLIHSFTLGVALLTILLLSAITYYLHMAISSIMDEQFVAAIISGLLVGMGIATWALYYRQQGGTILWLPRAMATFLTKRSKATQSSAESFSLGMMSVIAELLFIIAPLLAASLSILTLHSAELQLLGIVSYGIIALLPLGIITVLVGSGHNIAQIQQWRERHKRFLQFAAGGCLIILAAFVFVDRVVGITTYGGVW
ncbi:MAG: hypothetical protein Q4A34_01225 [Candidatus Saccharibacteria bacterium]|nr:hypothetical protein [Candidatus Saccharibacteria bacterium]